YAHGEAGKTARVPSGADGPTVTGGVRVAPQLAKLVDWTQKGQHTYMADVRRPEVQQGGAKHDPDETPEEFTEGQLRYGQTEEGAKYNRWMFGSGFVIRPDGTFTIEDLVPGKYQKIGRAHVCTP